MVYKDYIRDIEGIVINTKIFNIRGHTLQIGEIIFFFIRNL